METKNSFEALKQQRDFVQSGQMTGRRLLFIGIDNSKGFVWDVTHEMGIECYVVGTIPKESFKHRVAGYLYCDLSNHREDYKHCDAIATFVKSEVGYVDGCLTMYDDCIPLTALVCARLGKVGLPYAGALATKHKSLTFQELHNRKYGFPSVVNYTSRCSKISKVEDVKKASETVGFPAVMKADCGGGSQSTKIVHTIKETVDHFQFLKMASMSNERLLMIVMGTGFNFDCALMEYLHGSEHCVDLVFYHGELVCVFLTDKGPQILPDTFHTTVTMPSQLPLTLQQQVIAAGLECCLALGLDHGLFDVDIMLTASGPKLIEINARMGGFCQRELILHCYGLDLLHLACMLACDVRPNVSPDSFNGGDGCLAEPQLTTYPSVTVSRESINTTNSPIPKPFCTVVGLNLVPWRHKAALKTKARPENLQRLHDEGKLLFVPIQPVLKEEFHLLPFCTIAIKEQSLPAACTKLQRLCVDLGIEAPELASFCHESKTDAI